MQEWKKWEMWWGGGEVGEGGSLDLVDGGWSRETVVADWSD